MTDRIQRLRDLAVSESGFLFDPYTGLTFSLNQTGRFILERLRDGLSQPAIRQALEAGYHTGPGDDPLRDVREFLQQLRESGLIPADNPGPGVAVLRSIRHEPRFSGRLLGLAGTFLIPYPSQGVDALRERISYVHSRFPLDVIIPTLDSELPSFIALEEELRALGNRMYLPTRAQFELRSKVRLAELGAMLPLMALRRWKDAQKTGEEVLQLAPNDFTAVSRLAWIHYSQLQYGEAEPLYRRAVAAYPASAELRTGLGWTLLKQGRTREAREAFEAVLAFAPDQASAREGLGQLP